ncbi:helix-turn-helix domain-containing protein [Streptomyces sp. NPDC001795]|uniref:Crp/Fnr family transcriptional regulator n=1 Tax=Streptomyces sp. NPDC001795 TaxID=3154525 RepID=UPI00332644E0
MPTYRSSCSPTRGSPPGSTKSSAAASQTSNSLSDSVFKSVPQRLATTLITLATRTETPASRLRPGARHPQISLTQEQLAALAGTSRETTTKVLHDFADQGLLRLARGRITVLNPERLQDAAGWTSALTGIRFAGLGLGLVRRGVAGHRVRVRPRYSSAWTGSCGAAPGCPDTITQLCCAVRFRR